MPNAVPALEGLKPVEAIASQFYLRPAEVKAVCEEAGLKTLTVVVSRKRIDLVEEREAYRAITRHLVGSQSPARNESTEYVPLVERIQDQAEQLNELRRQLRSIEDVLVNPHRQASCGRTPGGAK